MIDDENVLVFDNKATCDIEISYEAVYSDNIDEEVTS